MKTTEKAIGKKVYKLSSKPFKSGEKINTIKAVIVHPVVPSKMAYTFEEDDSFVSVEMCGFLDE